MPSTSETGHAINISNFKLLSQKCAGFGLPYNPSNTDLTVVNMEAKWVIADTAQGVIVAAVIAAKEPINERQILFAAKESFVTRSLGILNSTSASAQVKADAKTLADDFRGVTKKKTTPATPPAPGDIVSISTSHQSYVKRAENYLKYVDLLASIVLYNPNEAELKAPALKLLYQPLKDANDNIGLILQPVDTALIARNKELYAKDTGIFTLQKLVKSYVKGKFGATAPETKLVAGIKFTEPKK